jgi:hypothetical protein
MNQSKTPVSSKMQTGFIATRKVSSMHGRNVRRELIAHSKMRGIIIFQKIGNDTYR